MLTEAAGRDQFRVDTAAAAFVADVPWEDDTNRADKAVDAPAVAPPRYDASQVLALAVSLGNPGESSESTTARADAYKKWILEND